MNDNTHFEVIAGNIGTVYCGPSRADALTCFRTYTRQSVDGVGRGAFETVHLLTVCDKTGLVFGSVEHTPTEDV